MGSEEPAKAKNQTPNATTASATETIITLSSTPPRAVDVRSARIERSHEARRRASWRPVSLPCRRSSQPSSLPTIAIPIGSPIRISRYGPTLGRDESASCEAAYTRPSGTPIHMTIEPTAISRTSIRAGGE